jgi:serine/threonine protein kinase/tetratricopeptide (TPR) repeat protein
VNDLTYLSDAVDAFEDSWQRGEAPSIDSFLPADATARVVVLDRLIHIDLEYRLRRGDEVRVESYVNRYGELSTQPTILFDLVAWECHLRKCNEPGQAMAEYRRRFPNMEPDVSIRIAPLSTPSSAPEYKLPAKAGRYRLEQEIARGAMGLIVRVCDEDFDRPLAMKVMRGRDDDFEHRFVREARMTGVLQHPGIPPVHTLGRLDDGRPYFVMKLIQGRSLQELLNARMVSAASSGERIAGIPALVTIFKNICDTVGYAHSQGVIHRDLKPANIMVGAFGEVQVMDWGLAKRKGDVSPDAMTEFGEGAGFTLNGDDKETVIGSILGTPPYMAPEQARGEGGLDPRTDVFGLGAILCEILTGRPPYHGGTTKQILKRAADADLAQALAALDRCGADVELIRLTRRCLSVNKEERPANGALVAEAIAQYRADLEERLQKTEIDRAAQQARADEEHKRRELEHAKLKAERKRRQYTVASAIGLVAALAAASIAIVLFQLRRADQALQQIEQEARQNDLESRKQKVNSAVAKALEQAIKDQADLHEELGEPMKAEALVSDIDRWQATLHRARAAWNGASAAMQGNRDLLDTKLAKSFDDLDKSLKADERDWTIAARLDADRLLSLTNLTDTEDASRFLKKLPSIFKELGVHDVLHDDVNDAARKIMASRLRYVLLAALDHWATLSHLASSSRSARPEVRETRQRLLALAQAVAYEHWRDEFFRDQDPDQLARRVMSMQPEKMPTRAIIAAAAALSKADPDLGAVFLQRAAAHHTHDFWLHLFQSAMSRDSTEKLASAKTAMAIRPRSAGAATVLGSAYLGNKDPDAALVLLHKAIKLEPNLPIAHAYLGEALHVKRDREGAQEKWAKALELDPVNIHALQFRGTALRQDGKMDEAIAELRLALGSYPDSTDLHDALGMAYFESQDVDKAVRHFLEALDTSAMYSPKTHLHLAAAFEAKPDWSKSTEIYRDTIRRAPKYVPAYDEFTRTLVNRRYGKDGLYDLESVDEALALLPTAIALAPNSAGLYRTYGIAFGRKKDWQRAVAQLDNSVEKDPHSAWTRFLLGEALLRNKQPYRAVAEYRKAVAMAPRHAPAHLGLAHAHFERGDYKQAIEHWRTATEIDSSDDKDRKKRLDLAVAKDKEVEAEVARRKKEADADPLDAVAIYRYGVALRSKHDLAGAIAQYRKALAVDPKDLPCCDALADALLDNGNFDEALKQFRRAIELAPRAIYRMERVADLLRQINDLPGAISQLKRIAEIDAKNPKRQHMLGLALADAKNYWEALTYYQKAIALGYKHVPIHTDIGVALMNLGRLKEARNSLDHAVRELAVRDPQRELAIQRLQDCDRCMALDRKSEAKDWREALELAELSQKYKHYYRNAARFYGAALEHPFVKLGKDIDHLREEAARSALLAAADQGFEPKPLEPEEQALLRGQALGLLQATLPRLKKINESGRIESRLDVWRRLSQWRSDADFAGVRDADGLALLPPSEQQEWRKLWSDVEQVLKAAPAPVSDTVSHGTLTDRDPERTIDLKLSAGQTCVIELLSNAFEPECSLVDTQDKRVARSADTGGAKTARLTYLSREDATLRIVVKSVQARGTGAYTLTIRIFAENTK